MPEMSLKNQPQIEGRAQRSPPALIPAAGGRRVAAAVARPAPQPVRAAPRRALAVRPRLDENLVFGLALVEELTVVRHAQPEALRLDLQSVCDAAVAEAEVVAVTLAVGR